MNLFTRYTLTDEELELVERWHQIKGFAAASPPLPRPTLEESREYFDSDEEAQAYIDEWSAEGAQRDHERDLLWRSASGKLLALARLVRGLNETVSP